MLLSSRRMRAQGKRALLPMHLFSCWVSSQCRCTTSPHFRVPTPRRPRSTLCPVGYDADCKIPRMAFRRHAPRCDGAPTVGFRRAIVSGKPHEGLEARRQVTIDAQNARMPDPLLSVASVCLRPAGEPTWARSPFDDREARRWKTGMGRHSQSTVQLPSTSYREAMPMFPITTQRSIRTWLLRSL